MKIKLHVFKQNTIIAGVICFTSDKERRTTAKRVIFHKYRHFSSDNLKIMHGKLFDSLQRGHRSRIQKAWPRGIIEILAQAHFASRSFLPRR